VARTGVRLMRVAHLASRHRPVWDALVASHPSAGFMQSWAWSRFKELEGYTAIRLGLFEAETLRGGAIAYAFASPAEASILAVPDGPVLDWSAPEAATAFTRLVAAFRRSAAGRPAIALRREPRLTAVPP